MATLTRNAHVLISEDTSATRQPSRRSVDWKRAIPELPVYNARNQTFEIQPGEEVSVFSGLRTLAADSGTSFDLALSALSSSRYRLTWTGGTAPDFRTPRTVASASGNLVLTLNANLTLTVTSSLGAIFGAVVANDTVLIPGASTGDTGPFDPLNEGWWVVLAASATTLTLARKPGTVFQGATETVAISADTEFQAFSATGCQVGDTLELDAGFSPSSLHAYQISTVAAEYIEFESSLPLATEAGVTPGASGVKVYSQAKRYVGIETDQEIAIKYNGATDETNRVEPILAGDPNQVGFEDHFGTVFSLSIKNRSTQTATVTFISAE